METSIPALIIGALLLIASTLTARSSLQAYDRLGASFQQMEARAGEKSQSRLAVTNASLDPAKQTLTVAVRNDGQTRIALFDRLDVIVNYHTSPSAGVSAWLPYVSTTPTAGTWSIDFIDGDDFEPGILNPGETAHLRVELDSPAESGLTNTVIIASETGSTVSAPFSS